VAWLPSSMLILLIFLSTPIRIEAGREPTPPMYQRKNSGRKGL